VNATQVTADFNDRTGTTPVSLCVEYGDYTTSITLPHRPGGYDVGWARCCRNGTIDNMVNPGGQGITVSAHITGSEIPTQNSSPEFQSLPPLFLCTNVPFFFSQAAFDPDGDSLVYEIGNPYVGTNNAGLGATPGAPQVSVANPMGPPPYDNVQFGAGFSAAAPFGTTGSLSIDPQSGLVSLFG
jgi:hypothetical protein